MLNPVLNYITSDVNIKDTLVQIITNIEHPEVVWQKDDILEIYTFTRIA
jgi:hypothetical protein